MRSTSGCTVLMARTLPAVADIAPGQTTACPPCVVRTQRRRWRGVRGPGGKYLPGGKEKPARPARAGISLLPSAANRTRHDHPTEFTGRDPMHRSRVVTVWQALATTAAALVTSAALALPAAAGTGAPAPPDPAARPAPRRPGHRPPVREARPAPQARRQRRLRHPVHRLAQHQREQLRRPVRAGQRALPA